ncbi:helix-turn-helix domain-containing protein [Streptomyces sp. NPDC006333]|uniref:helix-turn-helix domain-containing protein n=1 Tax=Streptomyces sp. NPDC006333 TaxID=3156753 RepID=UPI0033B44B28
MTTDCQRAREALGARPRELRAEAGTEGKAIAAQLGWQTSNVSRLQNGKQTPTRADLTGWARDRPGGRRKRAPRVARRAGHEAATPVLAPPVGRRTPRPSGDRRTADRGHLGGPWAGSSPGSRDCSRPWSTRGPCSIPTPSSAASRAPQRRLPRRGCGAKTVATEHPIRPSARPGLVVVTMRRMSRGE